LAVVEDACQAHGAEYKGRKAGTLGVAGCFSFYPGKNLGAFGEGGAVTTESEELRTKIQVLREHGQPKKYFHSVIGWNARMDGIQGAVLSIKLRHLARGNAARHARAEQYTRLLANVTGVLTPAEAPERRHVYHLYAVRVKQRDAVLQALGERGIGCGIHYPVPVHLQEAYRSLGYAAGSLPVSERCANEFLSLPMFPELTAEQVEGVVTELRPLLGTASVPHEATV
jgi:dTDP-4-amino-4,6-dideoxygalactose transaminase